MEEVRARVECSSEECGTVTAHIDEAIGGGGPGDAASIDEEEIGPWR